MCSAGKRAAVDKSKKESRSKKSTSIGEQQLEEVAAGLQLLNYEMWAHAYLAGMNNLLNGSLAPFHGLAQPDFATLLTMAAALSKHPGGANTMTPLEFHRQLHAESNDKPKRKIPISKDLLLARKSGLRTTMSLEGEGGGRVVKAPRRRVSDACSVDSEDSRTWPVRPWKKNYTQAELDQAITDIRCGRLGTRRASAVYGIPRSTLRNRIQRMEEADEQAGIPFTKRKAGGQSTVERLLADFVAQAVKSASTDESEASNDSSPADAAARPSKSTTPESSTSTSLNAQPSNGADDAHSRFLDLLNRHSII